MRRIQTISSLLYKPKLPRSTANHSVLRMASLMIRTYWEDWQPDPDSPVLQWFTLRSTKTNAYLCSNSSLSPSQSRLLSSWRRTICTIRNGKTSWTRVSAVITLNSSHKSIIHSSPRLSRSLLKSWMSRWSLVLALKTTEILRKGRKTCTNYLSRGLQSVVFVSSWMRWKMPSANMLTWRTMLLIYVLLS